MKDSYQTPQEEIGAPYNCIILNTFLQSLKRKAMISCFQTQFNVDSSIDSPLIVPPQRKKLRVDDTTNKNHFMKATDIKPSLGSRAESASDLGSFMGTLPPEILLHILSFLDIRLLEKMSRVNHKLYELINSPLGQTMLWKEYFDQRDHEICTRFHWILKRYRETGTDADTDWLAYFQMREFHPSTEIEQLVDSNISNYKDKCRTLLKLACSECLQLTRNMHGKIRLCEFCRLSRNRKLKQHLKRGGRSVRHSKSCFSVQQTELLKRGYFESPQCSYQSLGYHNKPQ